MKKLFALLFALCMIFSLTACAQIAAEKEKELEQAIQEGNLDDAADAIDDLADEALIEEGTNNLNAEEVVAALINGDDYKTTAEQFKEQGLLYKLEARDNYVAYVYQYTVDIGDTSVVKANCDAQIDTLKSVADSLLKAFTGIDGIIFEYVDYTGDIIATYKFN